MKLLVVDDEQDLRELISEFIVASGMFSMEDVVYARNGGDAIKMYEAHQPEIVITDIMMPGMNGVKLIENLRKDGAAPEVIVMTSYGDMDMAESIIKLGVKEFLRKPFEPEELVLAVRKILEKINLRQENDDFQKRIKQAEKLSSLGLLASGIAHEINNPNTFVRGNLQLLQKYFDVIKPVLSQLSEEHGPLREKYKLILDTYSQTIESAIIGSERIFRIVSGLLSFGRNSGDRRGPVSVRQLLDDAIMLTSHRLKTHEVRINSNQGLSEIYVNSQEITQVLMNLIVNSIDAIEERLGRDGKGLIEIHVSDDPVNEEQVILFKDNGIGMSEAVVGKIFDPFFTTKPVGRGTGLGLSISKGTVDGNGGRIACRSTPGEGTTFEIRLPIAPEMPHGN